LGHVSPSEVLSQMKDASYLVMPSTWYENAPIVLLQAFATGLPAIVSAHGALAEMVDGRQTGWLFTPGDSGSLAGSARLAWRDVEGRMARSKASREAYLNCYTAERNYEALKGIYQIILGEQREAEVHGSPVHQ